MDYIKVPKAYDKLKRAEKDFRPVYISAEAGWGKSAAVKYYYENKPVLVLNGDSGTLSDMPDMKDLCAHFKFKSKVFLLPALVAIKQMYW
jgi:hypothetical protein